MDKLTILLTQINKAIDDYRAEYQTDPIIIYSGLKCFKRHFTIQNIPIEYDERKTDMQFEVI